MNIIDKLIVNRMFKKLNKKHKKGLFKIAILLNKLSDEEFDKALEDQQKKFFGIPDWQIKRMSKIQIVILEKDLLIDSIEKILKERKEFRSKKVNERRREGIKSKK